MPIAALAPFLAACTPTTKKVCGHVTELVNKAAKEGEEEPTEDEKKDQVEKCKTELDKKKKDMDEETYKTLAKCVMEAKDMPAVIECNADAEKNKAK